MEPQPEPTVGGGDHVLAPDELGESLDPVRDQLRMLDQRCRVGHHARGEHLAVGQLGVLPQLRLVLVAHVGGLDQVHLGLDLEHDVDDVGQWEVGRVRAMPAAPTEVVPDLFLGDVAQGVVQRLTAHLAELAVAVDPHRDADPIPQRAHPGVVDLHLEPGVGDRLVLLAHRLGDGVDVLLVGRVDALLATGLDAERRRRGEERV